MAFPVAQIMAQSQEGVSDSVVAEAEEKADEAVEAVDEAEEMMKEADDCFFVGRYLGCLLAPQVLQ